MPGLTCEYTSAVKVMELWPNRSLTTLSGTPASSSIVAAVYAAVVAIAALPAAREYRIDMAAAEVAWRAKVMEVPAPAVIFVRTRPTHNAHDQMIVNPADLTPYHYALAAEAVVFPAYLLFTGWIAARRMMYANPDPREASHAPV